MHLLYNYLSHSTNIEEQSGAVEACWAHNPEVRRSKLRSAIIFTIDMAKFAQFLLEGSVAERSKALV